MKFILFILLLFSTSFATQNTLKVGQCFSPAITEDIGVDSEFGNSIYWKLVRIEKSKLIFSVYQLNSEQFLGTVTKTKELNLELEVIECPLSVNDFPDEI